MNIVTLKRGQLRELLPASSRMGVPSKCRIRASNDIEAIERWLDEYFDKPATFRAYKKEAERFFVWCARTRMTNFASLDRDDVEAYIIFIKNPKPKELWCGPRRKKSGENDAAWYPFAGPLSETAIRAALAALNSLMSYLVDAHYIEVNPFALVRKKNRFQHKVDEQGIRIHERILNQEEWQALLSAIEQEPGGDNDEKAKKERLRFLISALFFLGLRIDELAKAKWDACQKINGKWWFFVRGKGDRLGKVPINHQFLQSIMSYRHAQQLSPIPENDTSPLIKSPYDATKPLTVRQMSNLIKAIAKKAALSFSEGSDSKQKLLRFSPHWLRHLSASKQDLAGISFTNIKSNLRHQNEQTTRIYVHAYDDDRHQEMEKLTF